MCHIGVQDAKEAKIIGPSVDVVFTPTIEGRFGTVWFVVHHFRISSASETAVAKIGKRKPNGNIFGYRMQKIVFENGRWVAQQVGLVGLGVRVWRILAG